MSLTRKRSGSLTRRRSPCAVIGANRRRARSPSETSALSLRCLTRSLGGVFAKSNPLSRSSIDAATSVVPCAIAISIKAETRAVTARVRAHAGYDASADLLSSHLRCFQAVAPIASTTLRAPASRLPGSQRCPGWERQLRFGSGRCSSHPVRFETRCRLHIRLGARGQRARLGCRRIGCAEKASAAASESVAEPMSERTCAPTHRHQTGALGGPRRCNAAQAFGLLAGRPLSNTGREQCLRHSRLPLAPCARRAGARARRYRRGGSACRQLLPPPCAPAWPSR